MDKHIRKIFSLFVLIMIAVLIMRLRADDWSMLNWCMLAVGALACLLVFRVFVYIFNFSYALASIVNGVLLAAWFGNGPALLLGGLMALYGLRLLAFTWTRVRSSSYAHRVELVGQADAGLPAAIRVALWVQCSFLYCFHLFAIYYAGRHGEWTASVYAGAALILAGTVIEGLADLQKQRAKALAPDDFVATGLFRNWRHPNYVGEMLVQVGLVVVGLGAVSAGWGPVVAVTVAPLYVFLLMISECGRADRHMEMRYGDRDEFNEYLRRSGSMLPKVGRG